MGELKYATTLHPTIAAVVDEKYFFASESKARERLAQLKSQFVFSREGVGEQADHSVIWIKGYALSDDETERGYVGNFAHLTIQPSGDGFTLVASKVPRPITSHPQRKRLTSKHPNWGHPFLRRVKKGGAKVTYLTEADAQADLDRFHHEFPETSIPGIGRTYAHVWVGKGGDIGNGHIQKILLEIKGDIDGNFKIIWRPNYKRISEITDPSQTPQKINIDRSNQIASSIDDMFE